MGFRVRRSFKVAPGVRLSVSPKSVGISAGVKGARVSVNSRRGVTTTVGIAGSGISHSKTTGTRRPAATQPGGGKPPTSSAVTGQPKPGVFAPAWEKALYKAATGAGDAATLRRFAAEVPTAAGVLTLAEVIYYSTKNGDMERSRALLEWLHNSGYEPENDAVAQRYFSRELITLSIASGITATMSLDRAALALLLAEIEQSSGELMRAIEVVESLEPTTLAAVSLAELYADQARWTAVVDLTNGITNEDEASTYLLLQRGAALRELKYFEASVEALKEALRVRSRRSELRHLALIERGKTYLASGKKAMARKDFERVLADDSRFEGLAELVAAAN
ncbi:DUF4236 domain-containing protein [Rathayibacter rathayi]|uniref:DUF4236 domain-containing protein n=1 Tax=Rathayibacter rathayi TaxID=33887 RepID=UPI000CE7FB24|nr:DUF4236 domain-containing protein [Rathayibacter rathayi]PPG66123.1 hypothetical protein C5C02_12050 [Rathayibacter rathayi]PPG74932.1 hypothetical protein C5C23_11605 [Rathayibacter rathayi]PPI76400.1 hypothetical protein C5E03_09995 [Rathayibacter rathayi]